MSNDEYREFLIALFDRHVRLLPLPGPSFPDSGVLEFELVNLKWVSRLVQLMEERREEFEQEEDYRMLLMTSEFVQNARLDSIARALADSGILRAIEEDPEAFFGNLNKNVLPKEDAEFLREAGALKAESEITLLIHYARRHLAKQHLQMSPTELVMEADEKLKEAGRDLQALVPKSHGGQATETGGPSARDIERQEKKKRKLFTGIGKILQGAILGGGNFLIGVGQIAAPNPAVAAGVIASAGVAVSSIAEGIGCLRGE